MPGDHTLHQHTPTLSAVDPRGSAVRSIAYARTRMDQASAARISRVRCDLACRVVAHWDPRLWAASAPPDEQRIYTLAGELLHSRHVDAGARHQLGGLAEEPRWRRNACGDIHRMEYDISCRPTALFEQCPGDDERCIERLSYGGPVEAARGVAGRLIRHDDEAGRWECLACDVHGVVSHQGRRYLSSLDSPDWPASETALEPGSHQTRQVTDATGSTITMVDAAAHKRVMAFDRAGYLARVIVILSDGRNLVATDAIEYDAQGRICREVMGNGVVTTAEHNRLHGRLCRLRRARQDRLLQDLVHAYDPVGNVIRIEDMAVPTEWFAGEQVDPVDRYLYDSLSQLIEATGRESIGATGGPGLPDLALPGDGSRMHNYRETYDYDAAGNLLARHHVAVGNTYTRRMIIDATSNRAVPDNDVPPDVSGAFDGAGQQRHLQGGQAMTWSARGHLRRVVAVARPDGDDVERYVYDAGGERLRKNRCTIVSGMRRVEDVRYLPGLECHNDMEIVRVESGRSTLRVLRTADGDELRFDIDDRLHSVALELDEKGAIVSYEGYLPYGGTAWWAGRSSIEARSRSRRYSGRERDASGLYHYGQRYYAPWLCRWISTDPAGDVDGPNRYRFVRGNPVTWVDDGGRQAADVYDYFESRAAKRQAVTRLIRGFATEEAHALMTTRQSRRIAGSLGLAADLAQDAARVLGESSGPTMPHVDNAMTRMLRLDPGHSLHETSLTRLRTEASDVLGRVGKALTRRATTDDDRIVWMVPGSPFGENAFVNMGDSGQRIFMNLAVMPGYDRIDQALTLVHEETHIQRRTADVRYARGQANVRHSGSHADVDSVVAFYRSAVDRLEDYKVPESGVAKTQGESRAIDRSPYTENQYEALDAVEKRHLMVASNTDTYVMLAAIAGAETIVQSDRIRIADRSRRPAHDLRGRMARMIFRY